MQGGDVILLVTADARVRDLAARSFERAGYVTADASSGEEGLAAAKDERVTLIVLDLELPDMSGYEACHELRQDLGNGPAIILVSGARTEPADRIAGLLIGADDYVTRPFDPDELLARARRLLSRSIGARTADETPLTDRETQVLELLANGFSQDTIAEELFISSKTVGTHIQRVLTKLGVHSRTEAVAVAYRGGLVRDRKRPSA